MLSSEQIPAKDGDHEQMELTMGWVMILCAMQGSRNVSIVKSSKQAATQQLNHAGPAGLF